MCSTERGEESHSEWTRTKIVGPGGKKKARTKRGEGAESIWTKRIERGATSGRGGPVTVELSRKGGERQQQQRREEDHPFSGKRRWRGEPRGKVPDSTPISRPTESETRLS